MTRFFSFLIILLLLPLAGNSEIVTTFDQPDTLYSSNIVIDIIEHNGGVWFATGDGVNYSLDNGISWLLYNDQNGLVGDNISALFSSRNGRLWVGMNHSGTINGEPVTLSDGLAYTDDEGQNWTTIDFEALGIIYATGGDRTIFDIGGHDEWVSASGFAAGFLVSNDNGVNWRRTFPGVNDSVNYYDGHIGLDTISLLNRYFSTAIDTSHFDATTPWDDSIFIWAGTAGGLVQHIYLDMHLKPFSKQFNAGYICDSCNGGADDYFFLGTEFGITRREKSANKYKTRIETDLDGPPANGISAVTSYADKIWIGSVNRSSGFSYISSSDASGISFGTPFGLGQISSANDNIITKFETIGSRFYAAASEAGIITTVDTGFSWSKLLLTADSTSLLNHAYAMHIQGDTMMVGTDSGLVVVYLNPGGAIDSTYNHFFPENSTSSSKVIGVNIQIFYDTLGVSIDSQVVWTINRPTGIGAPMAARCNYDSLRVASHWQNLQVDALTYDINFIGDTAIVVGAEGLRFTANGLNPQIDYPIEVLFGTIVLKTLANDTVTSFLIDGNSYLITTNNNGFAFSNDGGGTYQIIRPNLDLLKPDLTLIYDRTNSLINFKGGVGISGNWIPVMGLHYTSSSTDAHIWLSTRSTGRSNDVLGPTIARGLIDTIGYFIDTTFIDTGMVTDTVVDSTLLQGIKWERMYQDDFAWNFGFNGDTVFAATNSGLIYNTSGLVDDWDTVSFVDDQGVLQILPNVAIYAVEIINGYIWVGTDDRTLRLDPNTLIVDKTYYVQDTQSPSDEVFAYPVPYSHSRDNAVDFRFVVENDASITLDIYDFAMNLVNRVIDNKFYSAGVYPTAGSGREVWNGLNEVGDKVAVGIYYFRVSYSTGEEKWGKLAIAP